MRLVKVQHLKIGDLIDLAGDPYVKHNLDSWRNQGAAREALQRLDGNYAEVLDIEQDTDGSVRIRWNRRDDDMQPLRFPLDHQVLLAE